MPPVLHFHVRVSAPNHLPPHTSRSAPSPLHQHAVISIACIAVTLLPPTNLFLAQVYYSLVASNMCDAALPPSATHTHPHPALSPLLSSALSIDPSSHGVSVCGKSVYPDRMPRLVTVTMQHTTPDLALQFGTDMKTETPPCEASYGISQITIEVR